VEPSLLEEWDDARAKKFEIRYEVEEVDLYSVATCMLQFQKLFGDLLWRAEDMHVSSEDALIALMATPGGLITAGHCTHEAVDRAGILGCDDGTANLLDFAFCFAAGNMRVDDRSNGAAPRSGEVADVLGMRWEGCQGIVEIGAARTGDGN
jgi:hypothetical protein